MAFFPLSTSSVTAAFWFVFSAVVNVGSLSISPCTFVASASRSFFAWSFRTSMPVPAWCWAPMLVIPSAFAWLTPAISAAWSMAVFAFVVSVATAAF